jgi:hypothetical protein
MFSRILFANVSHRDAKAQSNKLTQDDISIVGFALNNHLEFHEAIPVNLN